MSIASRPRHGAVGVPIVDEAAVDPPVLPAEELADPPLDFRLEDEDDVPPGYVLQPPPVNYLPPAPSLRGGIRSLAVLTGKKRIPELDHLTRFSEGYSRAWAP